MHTCARLLLSFSLAIVSGLPLLAQQGQAERHYPLLPNRFAEGYIVNFKGDTTYGYIRPGNAFRDQLKVFFLDYYGGRTYYHGDRIQGFGYENKHYLAIRTPYNFAGAFSDSSIFLMRLIEGPATLLRFYTRRSVLTLQSGPAYLDLLVKPDGSRHEISYAFKWERLADALADHPTLADDIRAEVYRPQDTEEIIRIYNQWYRQQQGGGGSMGD